MGTTRGGLSGGILKRSRSVASMNVASWKMSLVGHNQITGRIHVSQVEVRTFGAPRGIS